MDRRLEALRNLILDGRAARPEDLPALAMRAAETLGVEAAVVHLVEYGQVYLTPFTAAGTPPRDRIPVDGTLAGRTFAIGEICVGEHQTWVPMCDGAHRIGVLEVAGGDLDHPTLLAFATALAQLVASRRVHGDAIEHLRRGLPMQLATEIVWNLLPPLTFAAGPVAVTGILEPAYEVGGDAFDYATRDDMLHTALFDAVGHGIGASAMTTVAVNAYRNARRCGLDLVDSYRSIDKWISARYPEQFVTGALAELDQGTGLLRSICAGHPGGLLLRDDQLVKHLPAPTTLPLGLGGFDPETVDSLVVEEQLQPGDHVLFYTDGVIEARNEKGEFFGLDRLVDFVIRTLADHVPAAETMRRLIRALLDYQHGHLQDDATAVLVRWTGPG